VARVVATSHRNIGTSEQLSVRKRRSSCRCAQWHCSCHGHTTPSNVNSNAIAVTLLRSVALRSRVVCALRALVSVLSFFSFLFSLFFLITDDRRCLCHPHPPSPPPPRTPGLSIPRTAASRSLSLVRRPVRGRAWICARVCGVRGQCSALIIISSFVFSLFYAYKCVYIVGCLYFSRASVYARASLPLRRAAVPSGRRRGNRAKATHYGNQTINLPNSHAKPPKNKRKIQNQQPTKKMSFRFLSLYFVKIVNKISNNASMQSSHYQHCACLFALSVAAAVDMCATHHPLSQCVLCCVAVAIAAAAAAASGVCLLSLSDVSFAHSLSLTLMMMTKQYTLHQSLEHCHAL